MGDPGSGEGQLQRINIQTMGVEDLVQAWIVDNKAYDELRGQVVDLRKRLKGENKRPVAASDVEALRTVFDVSRELWTYSPAYRGSEIRTPLPMAASHADGLLAEVTDTVRSVLKIPGGEIDDDLHYEFEVLENHARNERRLRELAREARDTNA